MQEPSPGAILTHEDPRHAPTPLACSIAARADAAARCARPSPIPIFTDQVLPILEENCTSCHRGAKPKAHLDLTDRKKLLEGAAFGIVVLPGKASQSPLVKVLAASSKPHMPPKKQLSDADIATITKWIDGLDAADAGGPQHHRQGPRSLGVSDGGEGRAAGRQERKRGFATRSIASSWRSWKRKGLSPAPPADKARADPPRLLRPDRPAADARGGRGVRGRRRRRTPTRSWSTGCSRRRSTARSGAGTGSTWSATPRPTATSATAPSRTPGATATTSSARFNDDKPYDQFVREQLAGDELDPATTDAIIATGYYRLGLWDDEPADPRAGPLRRDWTTSSPRPARSFLGLTVGCARCHDHKIDPIPQKDYYRFVAFFHGVQRYGAAARRRSGTIGTRRGAASASRQEIAALPEAGGRADQGDDRDRGEGQAAPARRRDATTSSTRPNRLNIVRKHVPKRPERSGLADVSAAASGSVTNWQRRRPTGLAQALCVTESGPTPPRDLRAACAATRTSQGRQGRAGLPGGARACPTPTMPDAGRRRQDDGPAPRAGRLDRRRRTTR